MSVVAKAIELLGYFSKEMPEVGLSELCRMAKRDKATTYRHLSALEALGFIEQNRITKAYRIGPAVLPLAELRETTVPRREGALSPLKALADLTGETAHVAVLSGQSLHSLVSRESTAHSTRAVMDVRQLPLHATASGLCALAFGPTDLMDTAIVHLHPFTAQTATTQDAVAALTKLAQETGFAESKGSFESDIHSIAVPVFDHQGQLAGTVAVAGVANRMTPELEQKTRTGLVKASRDITRNWGGTIPSHIDVLWRKSLEADQQKELAP